MALQVFRSKDEYYVVILDDGFEATLVEDDWLSACMFLPEELEEDFRLVNDPAQVEALLEQAQAEIRAEKELLKA